MTVRRFAIRMHSPEPKSFRGESTGTGVLQYPGPGKVFLVWTAVGILTSLRFQFERTPGTEIEQLAMTVAFSATYLPWTLLTPLAFRIEKRFPLGTGNWLRNSAILIALSIPICLLASPLMLWLFYKGFALVQPDMPFRTNPSWMKHFPFAEITFWCSIAGGYFIRTLNRLREQEQSTARLALEKSQLEAGLKQAQLDVLRARLNPHFLFNSLQNISVMTKQDPQTASRMLTRLGDLLRAVLRNDSEPEHTLLQEVDLTRAYVALEQMRFGDRLEVKFSLAPEVQSAMVPCFILQPIIENAVIHGLGGVRKGGVIAVTASRNASELELLVKDNGIGLPDGDLSKIKIGVGVGSTRERLATMYPDRQTFSMRQPPDGGAEVRIAIPLRFEDSEEDPTPDAQSATANR